MLATLDSVLLTDEAEELGKMISESEIAFQYRQAKSKLKNDREAQRLIGEFIKLKDLYEEVQRFGRYHPDFLSITTRVREAKRDMDMHQTVAEYRQAEREMEDLLNEVSKLIAGEVSPMIKVPTGNPFFDKQGCGGGCGSGGSCGCS
ncbi:YlbF family regulator [Pseudalkalibacillus caeni]|uniref:YlbF family regulator n=1 Tax=Exobacillus caeni TaxID=2574798 RepID=A0A5R9F1Z1_9BACL|nr:YlbF family regulator [Pseudalkalibacillus caeni]TLS37652.1 YlbF family regulator [Pseudalkalibacillus caeni]